MVNRKLKLNNTQKINSSINWALIFLVFHYVYNDGLYGPIAAFLMFPVKIRYTSMSLPYHVGNGILVDYFCYLNYFVTNAKDLGIRSFTWKDFGSVVLLSACGWNGLH
jgi:hypothetical protein